jgi:hypothetical protein
MPGAFKVGRTESIGCGPSPSGNATSGQCGNPVQLTLTSGEVDHIKLIWAYVPG